MLKFNLQFRWYKLFLLLVTAGLLTFGLWAFVDSVSVGASHAAFRFLLLFVIWSLPGIAVLAFVRPGTQKEK
jgi:high-affinity Fe2+/Pb2+ permease